MHKSLKDEFENQRISQLHDSSTVSKNNIFLHLFFEQGVILYHLKRNKTWHNKNFTTKPRTYNKWMRLRSWHIYSQIEAVQTERNWTDNKPVFKTVQLSSHPVAAWREKEMEWKPFLDLGSEHLILPCSRSNIGIVFLVTRIFIKETSF